MNPFDDNEYKQGCAAREAGNLAIARSFFEEAAKRANPMALLDLAEVCFDLNDIAAAKTHAVGLEKIATLSAENSYVTSKAFEHGACRELVGTEAADEKRQTYLVQAASLGNAIAQIELAMNYAYGLNNFDKNLQQFAEWIELAASISPDEARRCFLEVAAIERLPIPRWVTEKRG